MTDTNPIARAKKVVTHSLLEGVLVQALHIERGRSDTIAMSLNQRRTEHAKALQRALLDGFKAAEDVLRRNAEQIGALETKVAALEQRIGALEGATSGPAD